MGGSDNETELKKKKEKKDKDKDKEKKDKGKDEKGDHGKDKHKDEKKDKGGKDKDEKKDKDKDEKKDKHKDEKDKHKDDKGKDDKHKDEKGKDKHKDEKGKEKSKDDKGKEKSKDDKDKHKDEKGKDKEKDKGGKEKDKKDKATPSHPVPGGEAAGFFNPSGAPFKPPQPAQSGEVPWFLREPGTEPIQGQPRAVPDFPNPNLHYSSQPPPLPQPVRAIGGAGGGPPVQIQNPPPSGYRLPLDPNAQFPGPDKTGRPPATDLDGSTPVFIGSAILPDSVHPCKIIPSLHPPCRVPQGGSEVGHHGRYDLLPITQDMEWVPTRNGQIPPGRRPVEGGYEPNGVKLYHALGSVQGVYVPGKTSEHLRGASILSGGTEHNLQENYSVLCWK